MMREFTSASVSAGISNSRPYHLRVKPCQVGL